jgi:hypothetical protein
VKQFEWFVISNFNREGEMLEDKVNVEGWTVKGLATRANNVVVLLERETSGINTEARPERKRDVSLRPGSLTDEIQPGAVVVDPAQEEAVVGT